MKGTHGVLTSIGATFTYEGEADAYVEGGVLILTRWIDDSTTKEVLGIWPLTAIVSYTCQDFGK